MNKKAKTFVKVHSEKGYGTEPFVVVREERDEYVLRDKSGKHFNLYKGHCYQDYNCKMLSKKGK